MAASTGETQLAPNTSRKEEGKRGGVLQTQFTYLGDELILFRANGNKDSLENIICLVFSKR